MANLDFIFEKAEDLKYLGNGLWQIKCPVKGCEAHTLQVEQTNYHKDRYTLKYGLDGQVTNDHGCSLGRIIDSFDLDPQEVFLRGHPFIRDSEEPKCFFDHQESINFLVDEAKEFANTVGDVDRKDPTQTQAQRWRYLMQGIQWYLDGGYNTPIYDPFGIYESMTLAEMEKLIEPTN